MTTGLGGLPRFLRHLGELPPPDRVLDALLDGPLGAFTPLAGFLWTVSGEALVSLASRGHSPDEQDRYGVIPLTVDLNVTRSVRMGEATVRAATESGSTHLADINEPFWHRAPSPVHAATVVTAPMTYDGRAVGAYGAITADAVPDDPPTLDLLRGFGAALGLWLTHPESGIAIVDATASRGGSLSFTPRQKEILTLVRQGRSTGDIVRRLHLSESAVKQDLRLAMRALRAPDRREAAARARSLGLI